MLLKEIPEKLIIDASILFSFFKSDSVRRKVIEELLDKECELISPSFVIEELSNNKDKILRYSKIDTSAFMFLFSLLNKHIKTFSEERYSQFLTQANKLSPHKEDIKDDPYFALSFALNKTPIWSDEPAFKEQSEIKIFSTLEFLKILGSCEDKS